MLKDRGLSALGIVLTFAVVGAGISIVFGRFVSFSNIPSAAGVSKSADVVVETSLAAAPAGGAIVFNPPAVHDAPANINDAVVLGYKIMTDTRTYAGQYVGNELVCSNCHFKGGMTEGGRNGGLSLAGVAAQYPKYREQGKGISDLAARTNSCFEKSMNGRPLPLDSREMIALLTYYQWISKGVPIYAEIPWSGVLPLKSAHKPDAAKGTHVFAQQCAMCHGENGQGTLMAPPLWGKDSFNDGAGMARVDNLSAFAHANMPLGNPALPAEDALDVAAFIATGSRPHFTEHTKQGG